MQPSSSSSLAQHTCQWTILSDRRAAPTLQRELRHHSDSLFPMCGQTASQVAKSQNALQHKNRTRWKVHLFLFDVPIKGNICAADKNHCFASFLFCHACGAEVGQLSGALYLCSIIGCSHFTKKAPTPKQGCSSACSESNMSRI